MRIWRWRIALPLHAVLAALLAAPMPTSAQDTGTHTGDVFGDLVHIKRDPGTGQPILQKRWVALPEDEFGWAYCPIPVDATGAEIPFAADSCDPDPAYVDAVVEVDYFGRLSGGRTKERNQRMHFDEVIDNIKAAEALDLDEAGRLRLGTSCDAGGTCATWKTVDSPMENLALYRRILKYGHMQTDPLEEDTSAAGDPALGTVYHPALAAEDWPKFRGRTTTLLPRADASQCFSGSVFQTACAEAQSLGVDDFLMADSVLAGAADKTGKITVDLVQYLNRILKIPIATPESAAAVDTLPALIRDEYGAISDGSDSMPSPANERFLDFANAAYRRTDWYSRSVLVLQTANGGISWQPTSVNLLQWLSYANGAATPTYSNMDAFVAGGQDALRVVEFIHEYEMPANLWGVGAQTTTTVQALSLEYRAGVQSVLLRATINSASPVNDGTVTFAVQTSASVAVGSVVTSGTVVNGVATAVYDVPAGTLPQTLVIIAVYSSSSAFASSTGEGSLLIGQAPTSTSALPAFAPLSKNAQVVSLMASVSSADPVPIGAGTVSFTVRNGANVVVGTPVVAAVNSGMASANYTIPGGLSAQLLTISAAYGGSAGYALSSGTSVLSLGASPLTVTSLTPDVTLPVPAGTAVTWTARVSGGLGPQTYKFNVFDGTSWTMGQEWSLSNTWKWYPPLPGNYTIQVLVRNAGSTSPYDATLSVSASISVPKTLTITSIVPSAISVPAGTGVVWTAAAAGGREPYTFAFYVHDGTSWTLGRDWSTSRTWTWTPAAAGTYTFQVWVRNAGSTTVYDAYRTFGPFTATMPSSIVATSLVPGRAAPTPAGTPVTWTATALGGTPAYTYQFHLFNGLSWSVEQDWSTSNTWTWVPPIAGTYSVRVWVRNNGSIELYDASRTIDAYVVTPPAALSVTSLLLDRQSPVSAGTPVRLSARAAGGIGPYTFKFYVFDGTTWTVGQDWSTSDSFTWLPTTRGTYTFQVWVRNAASVAAYDAWRAAGPMVVGEPAPLTVVSVTTSPGVPLVAGGPAVLTTTAAGGHGPYTYQFWVFNGTAWSLGQDWSPANTFVWTPPAAGTYSVQSWVRNAGSVATWDAWGTTGTFVVNP